MNNQDDVFPYGQNDYLCSRTSAAGCSPFEYLFFHLKDEKGIVFGAYFENIGSNEPQIFLLKKDTIEGLKEELRKKIFNCLAIIDQCKQNPTLLKKQEKQSWEIVRKPDVYLAGMWKITLKLIRDQFLNTNKEVL